MNSLFDLTGKKAIVTGGTRGLGHGMAEGLMEAGAAVVIFGTSKKVIEVAAQFEAKGYWCKGIAVGGLPGILSIQPTYWQVYAMAMAIAVVVPIILTSVVYQRKYRQGTLQIV